MTKPTPTNISASVHQLLLNRAHQTSRPFNEVLQYYAMERFLYRLSKSPHAEKFVLKGALMFAAWRLRDYRPTMDIDLLGKTKNQVDSIVAIMKEVCAQHVEPDGIAFDPATIQGARIAEQANYQGVRIRLRGNLGRAQVTMQVDVGFGDVVIPAPQPVNYPTILNFPPPKLRGYSRESVVAEKFESMVKLGILNSRMKDFFDIWTLARQFDFEGEALSTAIERTFTNRETSIVAEPAALTSQFSGDAAKKAQWRGFIRRNRFEVVERLPEVVDALSSFLKPIMAALSLGRSFQGKWTFPGPWINPGK